ncbi:IS5 family transposase [Candidatus Woesearchaeota archaeon]|nr:IS5 family transposase [Candidatus Woesearchaeota archaeon]
MKASVKKGEDDRWGNIITDMRNWKAYNEELVVRGAFYLDLKWAWSWKQELATMNGGKKGRPFCFPESLIKLQAVWHQWIDYRGIEGITRMLVEHALLPQFNNYSTTNRRVNKLDLTITLPTAGEVHVACDGTGIKMCNAGAYRSDKYGTKRRPYIRVILTADPLARKILAVEVNIEGHGMSEPQAAVEHLSMLWTHGKKIKKFWGDPGLDDRNLINWLDAEHAAIAIKPRQLRTSDCAESAARKVHVDNYMQVGYKQWAQENNYGMRWVGTEGIFSAVKRKFGEHVRSRKRSNMLKEAERKFWAYDQIQQYAKH